MSRISSRSWQRRGPSLLRARWRRVQTERSSARTEKCSARVRQDKEWSVFVLISNYMALYRLIYSLIFLIISDQKYILL